MLKYQVRTLPRSTEQHRRARKTILEVEEEERLNTSLLPDLSSSSRNSSTSSDGSSGILGPLETWRNSHGCLRRRGRSCSVSSLSSAGSSTESPVEWGRLRIFTDTIRPETDYKTFHVSTGTTAGDVVRMVLSKFRLGNRDPKLYYLSMILQTNCNGKLVENVLDLDATAKPLELQACHPKDMSRFVLEMRKGTPVKIYDYYLRPESNYKSILISRETTASEAMSLVLHSYRHTYPTENFVLVCVEIASGHEFRIPPEAFLVDFFDDNEEEETQIHLKSFGQPPRPPHNPPSVAAINKLPAIYSEQSSTQVKQDLV